MKTSIFGLLLCAMTAQFAVAADFEREGWIGEGVPHFSAKKSSLQLYQESSTVSAKIVLPVKDKKEIEYDLTKVITKKPAILTARNAIELDCESAKNKKPVIKPRETLEYMSYLGEGNIQVRYKGAICVVSPDEKVFSGLDNQPVVEVWVRVLDAHKKAAGWLLVEPDDKGQIRELDRTF